MNTITLLFIGTTMLELVLLNRYFFVLFRVSHANLYQVLACYLLSGGIIYVSSIFFFPATITGMLSLGSAFIFSFFYSSRMESKIIFSILYVILGFISESLSYFLVSKLQLVPGADDLSNLEARLLILLFSSLIMVLFIVLIRFFKKDQDYKLSKLYYILMTFIILTSLFILNTLFFFTEENASYVFSVIGILGINITVVYLFDGLLEKFRIKDELLQLQKQMDYQNTSYKKIGRSFQSIKLMIHDTNKHLLYIRACIRENELQEAVQHINKMLNQIEDTPYFRVATGNLAIDALLNNVLNVANDNNVLVKHHICIGNIDSVDRYDLCVVLGNILDNALEAVQRLSVTEERYIYVRIYTNNDTLTIHTVNSYNKNRSQINDIFKKNPVHHGVGLLNVQHIAEKYGGHLTTVAKTKQFETIIILPFKDTGSIKN